MASHKRVNPARWFSSGGARKFDKLGQPVGNSKNIELNAAAQAAVKLHIILIASWVADLVAAAGVR